jgi:hypothetical protein
MAKRTDIHRPSVIVPANYQYFTSYTVPSVENGPCGFNIDLVVKLQREHRFAETGGLGQCSICGARFNNGDVFIHEPTGEYIHMGQDCSHKYEMMFDRSAYAMELGRHRAATAVEITKKRYAAERQKFLDSHLGLEEALETNHPIVKSIASNFISYRSLSDKQIALVFKLYTESRMPAADAEKFVPAPIVPGRQTFMGVVVSAKIQESIVFGDSYKMTVKMTTPEGSWLAWGTIPSALLASVPCNDGGRLVNLRGATVEVTASLKPGRDAHFAVMKRPAGKIITQSPEAQKYTSTVI